MIISNSISILWKEINMWTHPRRKINHMHHKHENWFHLRTIFSLIRQEKIRFKPHEGEKRRKVMFMARDENVCGNSI